MGDKKKTVVDVGNCGADHGALQGMLEANFSVSLIQAHSAEEALESLRANDVGLLLVNRILDRDHSEGLEIIRQVKSDPALANTPCMLISNFAEYQQEAVEAGAERGFGKQQLHEAETREALAKFLA